MKRQMLAMVQRKMQLKRGPAKAAAPAPTSASSGDALPAPVEVPLTSASSDAASSSLSVDEVAPSVFVSSALAAADTDGLVAKGISLVINCAGTVTPPPRAMLLAESSGTDDCAALQRPCDIDNIASAARSAKDDKRLAYVWLKLQDNPQQELFPYLQPVARLIRAAVERGCGVVVHCVVGVSRSVSLATAYRMQYRIDGNTTLEEAIAAVRAARPVADPNVVFRLQLFKLQRLLNGEAPAPDA